MTDPCNSRDLATPVEPPQEALCFGWIDSTYRPLSSAAGMQRYTPRRKIGENYSQPNIERLAWLDRRKLIHPEDPAALW